MKFNRVFGMPAPNGDTFKCGPIGEFVQSYLAFSSISVDPFSRNCNLATYTNDLNPETSAQYHMDSVEFLSMLVDMGVKCDLVIFDPPYSPRQMKELYDGFGLRFTQDDSRRTAYWSKEKHLVTQLLKPGGIFLYFGWDTNGLPTGKHNVFIEEILLVNHGAAHNDTICMAQRLVSIQALLT